MPASARGSEKLLCSSSRASTQRANTDQLPLLLPLPLLLLPDCLVLQVLPRHLDLPEGRFLLLGRLGHLTLHGGQRQLKIAASSLLRCLSGGGQLGHLTLHASQPQLSELASRCNSRHLAERHALLCNLLWARKNQDITARVRSVLWPKQPGEDCIWAAQKFQLPKTPPAGT